MHTLFHIKTVIIPRDRYRPDGFSPRVDIGRGMITVLIWKKACINLFITYFNIELKRTNLTSHRDTKLMDMSDRYRLRVLLPKRQQIFPRWTSTFSKRLLTVGRKWRHGAHERLDIVLSEFCPDGRYRCGTSGVYVWGKLTLLLINMWYYWVIVTLPVSFYTLYCNKNIFVYYWEAVVIIW
jgi:hypothetical protein